MAHQELNISKIGVPLLDLVEIVQRVWKLGRKWGEACRAGQLDTQHSCLSLLPGGSQAEGMNERQAAIIPNLNSVHVLEIVAQKASYGANVICTQWISDRERYLMSLWELNFVTKHWDNDKWLNCIQLDRPGLTFHFCWLKYAPKDVLVWVYVWPCKDSLERFFQKLIAK